MDKLILKFTRNCEAKTISQRQNKVKVSHFLISKTYYEATEIKTGWQWLEDRHADQQNRI